jgi:hypothetical protein
MQYLQHIQPAAVAPITGAGVVPHVDVPQVLTASAEGARKRKPRRDPCTTIRELLEAIPALWEAHPEACSDGDRIDATPADFRIYRRVRAMREKLFRMLERLAGVKRAHTMGELATLALAGYLLQEGNDLVEDLIPTALARGLAGIDPDVVHGGVV